MYTEGRVIGAFTLYSGELNSFDKFELWRLSPQMVIAGFGIPVLQSATQLTLDPEIFFARVQYLNEHRDKKSHEEIQLKDGRVIDLYSSPVIG